ncbi:MAG: FAD-dependent oxidoreductase [Deltaproteobacteria bacterium]|jgi:NADH dehydrogenase FAD-containing subunit|nr:FAD-dependent oxidoreductase [Deltaproteobacteria bacterium]
MKRHLVLVGGGHAHLLVLRELQKFKRLGHHVTLINPHHLHFYSGMGPGFLGGAYRLQDICFNVKKMVCERNGDFVRDSVAHIDPVHREISLVTGNLVKYDVLSCNVGSEIAFKGNIGVDDQVVLVKPIINLVKARRKILQMSKTPLSLAVVGGGAAATEVAGNLQRLLEQTERTGTVSMFAGSALLPTFPATVRTKVLGNFRKRNIVVHENCQVIGAGKGQVALSNGQCLSFDMIFLATGIKPPQLFANSGFTIGQDGGLRVNRFLQSVDAENIFGGGDCIDFFDQPLDKVGVFAVRENPVLLHNLLANLENRPLKPFKPQKNYLLILNLGDGHGVMCRRNLVANQRWSFFLKDLIDRKFMKRYQVSGEQQDGELGEISQESKL